MKKLLLTISISVLISGLSFGQKRSVCDSCEFTSIREAIERSSAGDTLMIREGVYPEHDLIIDKPLTLIGEGNAVIDGEKVGQILGIYADSVSLINLTIKNVGVSHTKDHAALHISRSKYFWLLDNKFESVFFGILVEKSHHGVIEGNSVSGDFHKEFDSGNGIHLWHCSNVIVEDNNLTGLRDGIYLEFTDDSFITNNRSHNNTRYGLHFMFSNRDEYRGNHFYENGAGVAVMFSKFITMRANFFYNNWGTAAYGLLLKEIYDAEIENNVFRENTIAVNIDGSTRINYKNNDFVRNGWAVKVTGGCYTNIFTSNNFISNSFDISYNSKLNDNEFNGNYWSNYTGYDLDSDGVGDVPFRPVNLFSYIVNRTPETIILLRSLFMDIIDFSEKVTPVFTPDDLKDESPKMKRIVW